MRQPSAGVGGRGDAGFVRADQIDLKSLDEQLERHLGRPPAAAQPGSRRGESTRLGEEPQLLQQHRHREAWEIDPSKLVIKGVIARGTFSTVHRGVYDGQDVAVKLLDWGEDGHRSEQEIAALRAAFAQEVSVWHKLDHPNVTKVSGGRDSRPIGAYELAKAVEELGAGEILLNCIDCDGQGCGFDIDLIKMVSDAVTIPVIASSGAGAGAVEHFSEVFEKTNASAALAAGIFHRKEVPIQSVKEHLVDAGVEVRM